METEECIFTDSRQRLNSINIRILGKKKSSYQTARIKGFPVTETCEKFRQELRNTLPGEKFQDAFSFGFIDGKHKKIWVLSNADLVDAYAAAINGKPLWVDPNPHAVVSQEVASKGKQPAKRSHDETISSSITTKDPSYREKIEEKIRQLKEKHGDGQQPYQYNLWAEMLVLGSYTSDENPPPLPIFRTKVAKKAHETCTRTSMSTTVVPENEPTRSELLHQLKQLHELKELGVLTDQEFLDKKEIFMKDLK